MMYWIVHGSSLVRATRQQLRFETVPERYERQSKPAYLESVQKPLATNDFWKLSSQCVVQ